MRLDEIKNLLHGGDYNPDQWLDRPDILAEDIRLMKKAKVNVVTLGVFSWSNLEPEEGKFTFEWLDQIMDSMYENGIYVVLSTPSGARAPWLAKKYPEVMRTDAGGVHLIYGGRENHCNSSEVYKDKVRIIDEKLAERYAHHPALIMWHISNEIYGNCFCEKCQNNFRKWLEKKYRTIDELNKQYWSGFWSHKYNDWSEIDVPVKHGETSLHGQILDYKRFYSDLSIDFIKNEIDTIRKCNPDIPVTTNMFHHNCGINNYEMSKIIDIISWDSYPRWHCGPDKSTEWSNAVLAAFDFDFCRPRKNQSFYLMESVPSVPSQFEVCKLKRPGMHLLSAVQTIACGSDSVMYFQWRKSRGAYEKFHGAVLDHNGSDNTRVFKDVCAVGQKLEDLSYLKGAHSASEVAVVFDWENLRALSEQKSLKNKKKDFDKQVMEHYEAILKNYISVDIICQDDDFSKYKLIIAPVLYMIKEDNCKKVREYISKGGRFVLTYYSGIVNENDLCYEGYPPYTLNDVFGIKSEEVDSICDDEYNEISYRGKRYKAVDYCDLITCDGAEVLSHYEHDFYKGKPALTRNLYGQGMAYYIAYRSEIDFLYNFYMDIIVEAGTKNIIDSEYVNDVMVKERGNSIFIMNFSTEDRVVSVNEHTYMLNGYGYEII
jgi:beta-galactosidase